MKRITIGLLAIGILHSCSFEARPWVNHGDHWKHRMHLTDSIETDSARLMIFTCKEDFCPVVDTFFIYKR